ncbi:CKLF-like MARVEL transmembrane domain-containing protein 6 [Mastacembelus armatus]|uniref:CKLF-like MARVEL transmembrane domain containing 6 n=1 Tax=Mastacembelus armatus TaxID=205130 RepID=A0A3Q3SKP6_9TELE|nr:CKLF-like MARVEL transmembrane domain-containing protein 6 [Mastacembelus armatus]
MATTPVYSATTTPNPKSSWCLGPTEHLDKIRFVVKVIEVLFSFVAFILEEVVNSCISCSALYFFEFVSCSAFLFTLLLLVLLSTTLHTKVGITCWPTLDLVYTAVMALLLLISSCAFASDNSGTEVEKAAVAFGFLAMVAFAADLVLFIKNQGFPWSKAGNKETANGGPAHAPPEAESLNRPDNTTD